MEESYTNDFIAAEDRIKSLQNQIAQPEDSTHPQNQLIEPMGNNRNKLSRQN